MRGITEERLVEIGEGYMTANALLALIRTECKELNTWQPIETAPKDRQLLLRNKSYKCTGQWGDIINEWIDDGSRIMIPTHWQELPEDPKEQV